MYINLILFLDKLDKVYLNIVIYKYNNKYFIHKLNFKEKKSEGSKSEEYHRTVRSN